ncbi:hypothetical protein C5167_036159 [Papaver somniferum]|nr:hypothetical protein C5167_036159 [Papaver somniferum]
MAMSCGILYFGDPNYKLGVKDRLERDS